MRKESQNRNLSNLTPLERLILHVKVQGKVTPVSVNLYAIKRRCISTQSQPLQFHSPVTVLPVPLTRNLEWPPEPAERISFFTIQTAD